MNKKSKTMALLPKLEHVEQSVEDKAHEEKKTRIGADCQAGVDEAPCRTLATQLIRKFKRARIAEADCKRGG